ncbi:alpha/beta fold hydrolase [Kitasatospora sp. NPDC048296]|uniref:thioesterase II family protein n=1 Tax=Kitasatospora sp. NPDC048296 TaxID=3364048 RepID=UPI0037137AFB
MTTWLHSFSTPSSRTGAARRAAARVVCLPYTGGTASAYRPWRSPLPAEVELLAVELPGHGMRMAQEPLEEVDLIARCVARELLRSRTPLVLFGHSTGALLAYEVSRLLCAAGAPPAALVLCAMSPADCLDRKAVRILAERDELLMDQIRELGHTLPRPSPRASCGSSCSARRAPTCGSSPAHPTRPRSRSTSPCSPSPAATTPSTPRPGSPNGAGTAGAGWVCRYCPVTTSSRGRVRRCRSCWEISPSGRCPVSPTAPRRSPGETARVRSP